MGMLQLDRGVIKIYFIFYFSFKETLKVFIDTLEKYCKLRKGGVMFGRSTDCSLCLVNKVKSCSQLIQMYSSHSNFCRI